MLRICYDTLRPPCGIIIDSWFLMSSFDTFKGFGLRKFLFHMNKDPELISQDVSKVSNVQIFYQ